MGPGVDLEGLDRAVDLAALVHRVDQAPPPDAGRERQGDVLPDRSLHQEGLCAVGGNVDQAGPDGIRRVVERHGRAVDEQLAGARALRAGQDVEQLVLALALQGHDTEHLALVEVERYVVELCPSTQAASGQARRGFAAPILVP